MTPLYEDRRRAESFGEDPDLYDRARPSYPAALVDDLMADGPTDVIDVGCGTGIVSRIFIARGCNVLGVEVDERMAGYARAHGVTVEVGKFETWDSKGRQFDLLVSGQAWHWIDPLPGARAASNCLHSGARFAVFWNRQSYSKEVTDVLFEVYERLAPHLIGKSPLLYTLMGKEKADLDRDPVAVSLEECGGFDSIERRKYEWEREYAVDEWLGHVRTSSDHRLLPADELSELLRELDKELTKLGGRFVIHYDTYELTALKN
ncbi:MAG: class I SAM-dependent methyltransferase [Acidimicrobiales bacterium]